MPIFEPIVLTYMSLMSLAGNNRLDKARKNEKLVTCNYLKRILENSIYEQNIYQN